MPMFSSSRYHELPVYEVDDPERGRTATVAIRPSTPPPAGTATYRHVVTGTDTIEYLAWRFFGSSDAWWKLAEANPGLFPLDLRPGMSIVIPGMDEVGRVVRTRRF
jgi:hypothetical protein